MKRLLLIILCLTLVSCATTREATWQPVKKTVTLVGEERKLLYEQIEYNMVPPDRPWYQYIFDKGIEVAKDQL